MLCILLALLLSSTSIFGYEQIWETDFLNEEEYGYYGEELNLPTNEWSIDLRGTSLHNHSTLDWFRVESGVLEGVSFDCSSQLDTIGVGIMWKSRIIQLDSDKTYYVNYSVETSDNWDISSIGIGNDFVRLGYYDDNQQFIQLYEKSGVTERTKISGHISNTSECQLIVEADCNSATEILMLREVNLHHDYNLGDSSALIITKMCSPVSTNNNNRYIQITNTGNHLIDLTDYNLESIHNNRVLLTWELNGFILPQESLVIGDQNANEFFCNIGKDKWSSKSAFWEGIASNNDGAQLVRNDTREITDRVVGVNFYGGFIERKPFYLLASDETNEEGWDYQAVTSSADSSPGEYTLDETLPISLYSTNFSFTESGYLFHWTTFGESNLIGYNLFYSENSTLSQAIRINPQLILAQNSVQYNNYSCSLAELDSSGSLWLEVISLDQPNSYSNPIVFSFQQADTPEVIEVIKPIAVTLFPNPTSSGSYLKVSNSEQSIKEIKVYNIKGQLVGELTPRNVSDICDIQQITKSLCSGIYFVATKFETKVITRKLILTK